MSHLLTKLKKGKINSHTSLSDKNIYKFKKFEKKTKGKS